MKESTVMKLLVVHTVLQCEFVYFRNENRWKKEAFDTTKARVWLH